MKKMTKLFALALLAGAMISCSTDDTASSTPNGKVAVQFTGGISVNTRAAGVAWADGDKIGIFMTGANQPLSADAIKEGVDNVCYQSNGSIAFSPVSGGKTVFFPIDGDVDFYSYYPQTTVNDYKVALDVTDQTKQETIDFMYAKTEGCNKATPQVDLKFFHKLSNLILEIEASLLYDDFSRFLAVPYTEVLKSVRTALGLSQKAFAERIGIVPSYYYKIEEGNRRPSRKVYQKIYAAIETTSLQTSLLGEHPLQ